MNLVTVITNLFLCTETILLVFMRLASQLRGCVISLPGDNCFHLEMLLMFIANQLKHGFRFSFVDGLFVFHKNVYAPAGNKTKKEKKILTKLWQGMYNAGLDLS